MLLFGRDPERFFPRARIRFVRYEGCEAKVGAEMNGNQGRGIPRVILQVTEKGAGFVRGQIRSAPISARIRAVWSGMPGFAWKELVVNAVAHQDTASREYGHSNQDVRRNALTMESLIPARYRAAEQYAAHPLFPKIRRSRSFA